MDGTLAAVLARDAGPLTLYLNAGATTANGNSVPHHRPFLWSLVAGARWRRREADALVADVAHAAGLQRGHGEIDLLEIGWQHDFRAGPAVGRGSVIGLDDHGETPAFGAGLRVVFAF